MIISRHIYAYCSKKGFSRRKTVNCVLCTFNLFMWRNNHRKYTFVGLKITSSRVKRKNSILFYLIDPLQIQASYKKCHMGIHVQYYKECLHLFLYMVLRCFSSTYLLIYIRRTKGGNWSITYSIWLPHIIFIYQLYVYPVSENRAYKWTYSQLQFK